jgi:ectoine hydroxylase-related dioxygenase (phytanoyl-CoA dioxygenase family)
METYQVPLWGHQAVWDIRQHPALHAALSTAWETERLWVSIDTCSFTPPARAGLPDPLALHWDMDPRTTTVHMIQGVLALADTPADGGGFRCAPSWRNAPERWPDAWTQQPWGEEYLIDPAPEEIVQVPAEQGDLILWESSLPHGTVGNLSSKPRLALYVSMFPAGTGEEASQRVADFDAGRFPAHGRWKPGHDIADPGPTPTLTPLGQRLLGREPWE